MLQKLLDCYLDYLNELRTIHHKALTADVRLLIIGAEQMIAHYLNRMNVTLASVALVKRLCDQHKVRTLPSIFTEIERLTEGDLNKLYAQVACIE